MKDYQICYTKLVQVQGDKSNANIYEKGCIVNLATGEEKYISGEFARLILNAVEVYHESENKRIGINDEYYTDKFSDRQQETDFIQQYATTIQDKIFGEES